MGILRVFWRDRSGISSVEYAMLTAMVAVGVVLAVSQLSGTVSSTMNRTTDCLTGAILPGNCQ
jgi:Flp pilus assembly pilin Flp